MLSHVKVLKRGRPGSAKYRAAIKALGLVQESKADTSKEKVTTGNPKERSGVCFGFRDKGECKYGSKCRYIHDQAQIGKAQEEKASPDMFSVNLASGSREAQNPSNEGDFQHIDSYNDVFWDAEDRTQDHHDGYRGSEIQFRDEESPARVNMHSASK